MFIKYLINYIYIYLIYIYDIFYYTKILKYIKWKKQISIIFYYIYIGKCFKNKIYMLLSWSLLH